ncbi:MAG: YfhO family protein [Fuerstiella sp.]
MSASIENHSVSLSQWLLAIAVGLGLSVGVWHGLATGGGLVGGDTYPYFMPQKLVLAEGFSQGEIPLWHPLTGLGYPLHAESQAGVFYPTNQILYRILSINQAYNVSILLHYWLAFVFAWRFARCQRISTWPALLSALVYVYGWFPARISLEWSIIGGLWLPLTLWLTDRLIDFPSRRRIAVLALCLGIHLLAGHFTLAFINQLTVIAYAVLKLWFTQNHAEPRRVLVRHAGLVVAAVACGLTVAAVQLIPTFELRQVSQREEAGKDFDPAYGHMPPLYGTQLLASWWYWHTPEVRTSRQMLRTPGAISADTNAVEAHLYWGLLPLALVCGSLSPRLRRRMDRRVLKIWLVLSLSGFVYATGWLMPVTRHLPGFSFFMGPARYTILCALGGGLIAGLTLDQLLRQKTTLVTALLTVIIGGLTLPDMLWSSHVIADAVVVAEPPIVKLNASWLKQTLQSEAPSWQRLLAPGPNVCNLFGVSCIPQYLGLGPSIYYTDQLRPAASAAAPSDVFPDAQAAAHIESLGITHILTLEPIRNPSDALTPFNPFPDSFLNSVWARGGESCYLYELNSKPQRIIAAPEAAMTSCRLRAHTTRRVEFEVNLQNQAVVTLRELNYPGWTVRVDGKTVQPSRSETVMRSVTVPAGQHLIEWYYAPTSFVVGILISGIALLLLILSACRPSAAATRAG